jgi:hypothetical protein
MTDSHVRANGKATSAFVPTNPHEGFEPVASRQHNPEGIVLSPSFVNDSRFCTIRVSRTALDLIDFSPGDRLQILINRATHRVRIVRSAKHDGNAWSPKLVEVKNPDGSPGYSGAWVRMPFKNVGCPQVVSKCVILDMDLVLEGCVEIEIPKEIPLTPPR